MEDDDMPSDDEIEGAIVLTPRRGLTSKVVILDYKSLYPTIMMAYNLCYSTEIRDEEPKGPVITTPCGGRFVDPSIYVGIVPRILKTLLSERLEAKKAMKTARTPEERDEFDAKQYAMKILLNSIYGYTGYARARVYSPIITNSVTSYGRENLLKTQKIVEDHAIFPMDGKTYNLSVVAGDTDSIFISISGENVDFDIAKKIGTQIANIATSGLPSPMELVFEAYAERILILAKKHYAMYRFENPEKGVIKAKGIETVRRDWCNLTAKTLTSCLEMILIEGDVNKALSHARDALNTVKSPNNDDITDLIMTRTLTRKPENYAQPQPHAELIKKLEERGVHKYMLGDRVQFVIIKGEHKKGKRKELMTQGSEDPDYVIENGLKIDTDYYIEKQLLPPLYRMFECFGINEMDLMQKSRQRTLFS